MASGLAATVSASRRSSVGPGTTAAISVTARASGPSAPTRTATASRIVTGTASDGAASTSVTKKGLPPDTWCRSRAGRPVRRASVSTAVSDSGAGSIRRRTSGGMAPRALRTSGRSVSASVRHVITRQPRERARRRPRSATRSSVASSAQCTSSTTRIDRERVSSSRTAASSDSRDPSASSASDSAPPASRATSRSGPSVRGVTSGSHAPQRTRRDPTASQTEATSAVLPIPASPPTTTTRPSVRDASNADLRRVCSSSRSSSSTPWRP